MKETSAVANLLRDVIGNPLGRRPEAEPAWLVGPGGAVPKLARLIYEERAFERLPVLADALTDAGCTDAAFLDHCRSPTPHARGCWLVDVLLGKG